MICVFRGFWVLFVVNVGDGCWVWFDGLSLVLSSNDLRLLAGMA